MHAIAMPLYLMLKGEVSTHGLLGPLSQSVMDTTCALGKGDRDNCLFGYWLAD